ncbi:MAG: 30S ribosomal protein S12 methylthiotransferase RimO [Spirochaetaceae bacterium]|nr:30S ribosomal protein S12 methylthiotransferase RimO [Spirochaetaceae bacterium]
MNALKIKSYHVESLGCAKNQVDSELLMGRLEAAGMSRTSPETARLIIVNSCGFIESAKRQSINTLLELRRANPRAKIILTGCLAKRYEEELRQTLTEADVVCATIDAALEAAALDGLSPKDGAALEGRRPLLSANGSAYVKIAEGCGNRCSFCAIPLMRGPLVSRSVTSILEEITALTNRGVREICLVAQDTASFGTDTAGRPLLGELLSGISAMRGDFWLRLLYLHPDHFPLEILDVMGGDSRILPYFDIPFQHASEKILRKMGRYGSSGRYLELVARIRAALPGAVLRSTFLAGFPGEDESDFRALRRFQEEAALEWMGVFSYSREEGTAAYDMGAQPSKSVARKRAAALEKAQVPISCTALEHFVKRELSVLVEARLETGLYLGRAYLHAPEVDGAVIIESKKTLETGVFTTVKVTSRKQFNLYATA